MAKINVIHHLDGYAADGGEAGKQRAPRSTLMKQMDEGMSKNADDKAELDAKLNRLAKKMEALKRILERTS